MFVCPLEINRWKCGFKACRLPRLRGWLRAERLIEKSGINGHRVSKVCDPLRPAGLWKYLKYECNVVQLSVCTVVRRFMFVATVLRLKRGIFHRENSVTRIRWYFRKLSNLKLNSKKIFTEENLLLFIIKYIVNVYRANLLATATVSSQVLNTLIYICSIIISMQTKFGNF